MKEVWAALKGSLDLILGSRELISAIITIPLFAILVIAAMLSPGTIKDLPIGVVDEAATTHSRAFLAELETKTSLSVSPQLSRSQAERSLRVGETWATVIIPRNYDPLGRIERDPIIVNMNASYLSVESTVKKAVKRSFEAAVFDEATKEPGTLAMVARADVFAVETNLLTNPSASYELWLELLIHPAVLHLAAGCSGVFLMMRFLELRDTAQTGPARPFTDIGGLAGAGLLLFLIPVVTWMIWIFGIRGLPPQGSVVIIIAAHALLIVGSLMTSFALMALTRDTGLSYSFNAVYAGSALAYSGGTLPTWEASAFVLFWHRALPFTHYLQVQMDQTLGSSFWVSLPQILFLSGWVAVGWCLAVLALQRDASKC